MRKLIGAKLAGKILLAAMGLLFIFHILVLLEVIPASIIWGGQIGNSATSLITLEIIALAVTILFMLVIAAKAGYIRPGRFGGLVTAAMWIVFAYLALNTLGNLASGVAVENLILAPVTLVLAFLALRLAIEK